MEPSRPDGQHHLAVDVDGGGGLGLRCRHLREAPRPHLPLHRLRRPPLLASPHTRAPLTHALPARHWYTDASSQWTLDYPPFFAYLSRILSLPAPLVDANLVSIPVPDAPSFAHLLYLRLTVAFSDLLLLGSVLLLARDARRKQRLFLALALVLWSPALLTVDHVHFQYNGILMGLLLLSLHFLEQRWDLAGGVVFACLLCSKSQSTCSSWQRRCTLCKQRVS